MIHESPSLSIKPLEHAPPVTAGARLGTVIGDRVCAKCFFNLAGQPVLRETHYGLVIVRCPECGTVASLQEYPHISRWTRRLLALLGAAWFAFLILAVLLSGVIIGALSESAGRMAAEPAAMSLAVSHQEYQKKKAEVAGPAPANANTQWWANQAPNLYAFIEQAFLDDNPPIQFFDKSGGWTTALTPRLRVQFGLVAFAGVLIGGFWSVVLPHAKRWRRVLIVPVIVGVAAALSLLRAFSVNTAVWGGYSYALFVMQPLISPYFQYLAIALATLPLIVGVYVGRPLARFGVRALVPPRLREPLQFFWLYDGKSPPRFHEKA